MLIALAPHTNFSLEELVLPDLLKFPSNQFGHLDKSPCPSLHPPKKLLSRSVIPNSPQEPF